MANQLKKQTASEEGGESVRLPAPQLISPGLKRRLVVNSIASALIRIGGVLVLFCILAIFLVILFEALPLFRPAKFEPGRAGKLVADASPIVIDVAEDPAGIFSVSGDGAVSVVPLADESQKPISFRADLGAEVRVTAGQRIVGTDRVVLGTSDGQLLFVRLPKTEGEALQVEPASFELPGAAVEQLVVREFAGGLVAAGVLRAQSGEEELRLFMRKQQRSLAGDGKMKQSVVTVPMDGRKPKKIALTASGKMLFVALADGGVLPIDLKKPEAPRPADQLSLEGRQVSALDVLLGDQTLAVGEENGKVSSWGFAGADPQTESLKLFHEFESHDASVTRIAHSSRNRSFVTGSANGTIQLHYSTSGETTLALPRANSAITGLSFSPKGDQVLTVASSGEWSFSTIFNPHPEASLRTLFGKVWYEGYSKPEYVWQSSSGSDEFEPKLSFVPLIYGTLKGTFYSMLFAVPIALLSALYVSEFMSVRMRNVVKPLIELMAALPSVVIGFIAGLWLAPAIAPIVPGFFLAPFVFAAFALAVGWFWSRGPAIVRRVVPRGREMILLVPAIAVGVLVSAKLGRWVELHLLRPDFGQWLVNTFGVSYDQRNALVVGVAMGFAIVPLIFTIAEDSLSAVPMHLRAASLALGANRWQTAVRIILPAASPGIFSAIMLGFGRAVGETMIVLMATGNTPVMDPSAFNGFRALSANIAVELPEAAAGSTLYRILFLASLLLFCVTFIVNTATEFIRQNLRRKYSQV
ncbi:MAG: ABC transporter permease subunit [Bdellovibrionota bacterium]